jgi:hypothetical protein
MQGAAFINQDDDVYLASDKYITISAALTGAVPAAKITPASYPTSPTSSAIKVLDGDSLIIPPSAPRFTVTPSGYSLYQVSSDGKIYPKVVYYVAYNGNDAGSGDSGSPFLTIQKAISMVTDANITYYIYVNGTITGGTTMSSDSMAYIDNGKKVVLAGYYDGGTLDAGGTRRVLTITGGAEVTLGAGLTLTGGSISTAHGAGVYISGGSKFTMSGGEISENTATDQSGGGVCISGGSRFIMTGGEIRANTCTGALGGGGIFVETGHFTLVGGTVYGNTAGPNSNFGNNNSAAMNVGSGQTAIYGDGTTIPVDEGGGTDATITWP